jgi:glycosyltransferase involved in cell wall biosynthesis
MKTVHLVYPHGSRVSCPDAIGRNLARRLRDRYNVKLYDWTDRQLIVPGADDVLIGHAHPLPWTCFRRSFKDAAWRRVILMEPYHHGDDVQVAFIDPIIPYVDLFLAITGNYWFSTIASSGFAHWLPKMVHLDLAVDGNDFPPLKQRFNPPRRRRFVYIGSCVAGKNVDYLSEIADRAGADIEIAWIGSGPRPIRDVKALGFVDFGTESARRLIAEYDFLLTVGKADANPATILEAMAWGLIPVCTKQSGYAGYPGIINVPLADPAAAVSVLKDLEQRPDGELQRLQRSNWEALQGHFSWDRFARQVIDAIETDNSPALAREAWRRKWALRLAAAASKQSPLRPRNLARLAHQILT